MATAETYPPALLSTKLVENRRLRRQGCRKQEIAMSKFDQTDPPDAAAEPLGLIAAALGRIRFGAIQLTVHEGKVTQVDVTERRRFSAS
jgi:hypothetical protein